MDDIIIYGSVDKCLEKTLTLFQENNIGAIVRDEREWNRIILSKDRVPQGCTNTPSSTERKRNGRPPEVHVTKATLDQRRRRQMKKIHKEAGTEIIASKSSLAQQKRRQREKQSDALPNLSTNNEPEPNDVPVKRCCISKNRGLIGNDTPSTTRRGNNMAQTNRQPLSDITPFHPSNDEVGLRSKCPIAITPKGKENLRNNTENMHVSRKGKEKESERQPLQDSFVRRRNTGVVICEGGRKDYNHATKVIQNKTTPCSGKGNHRPWQAGRHHVQRNCNGGCSSSSSRGPGCCGRQD